MLTLAARRGETSSVIIYLKRNGKSSDSKAALPNFGFCVLSRFARGLSRIPSIERGCHTVEIRVDVTVQAILDHARVIVGCLENKSRSQTPYNG